MARRPNDFYPTAPDSVEALRLWLGDDLASGLWHDPAAGKGGLLKWLGITKESAVASEVNPDFRADLDAAAAHVSIGDSLALPWIPANIVANPPFNLLDDFIVRILDERAKAHGCACILTRTQWWQAQKRRDLPKPDFMLLHTWRLSFTGDGATDSMDYAWAVYLPNPTGETRCEWLPKPAVPQWVREDFELMTGSRDVVNGRLGL